MTDTPTKPGPKRTGSVEPVRRKSGPGFVARIRLGDGSRARVDVPAKYCTPIKGPHPRTAREHAELYATARQEQEDEDGKLLAEKRAREAAKRVDPAKGETCDQWYERFMKHRRTEVGSVDDDKWRWSKWISKHIGQRPIRDVTADNIEDIRDALNVAVAAYEAAGCDAGEGRLAPKTARHIWSALTVAFKYAATRKGPRELRVREDKGDPCAGLPPPRDGASKKRHWCRPGEILAVLSCPDVPLPWREAIAIGCYLHLRPGELYDLRKKDVDLSVGEVRIARAYDEREKTVKVPKTDEGIRTVTIPPTLLPLLKRMVDEREAEDLLAPVVSGTPEKSRAGHFRDYLKTAKVERAELFEETATHLWIDFRSLRDTGITWRFLAEHRAEVVQREAGHEHISTTLGYAKEVHNRQGRYGEPFPALPKSLVEPDPTPQSGHESGQGGANYAKSWSGRRDLNAHETAELARIDDSISPTESTRVDVSPRSLEADGPLAECTDPRGNVQNASANGALEEALRLAARAGEWSVVAALADELRTRRRQP